MSMTIDKAVFITNIFAESNPEVHTDLWKQFEREVPVKERSGMFGASNIAYIKWLKVQNNPVFNSFIANNVSVETL